MAKEQAAQSLDPVMMVLGSPVYSEDSQAVIKQANWTFGNRPMCHINQVTGKRTGGASSTPSSLQIEFRAIASGSVEVLRFYVQILPETVNVTAGAECYMVGGEGSVKFTIGASSQTQTFSHASGHSGVERTLSFATSATGTGWQLCTIEVEKTSGTSDIHLSRFRIQDDAITSGLPDPVIEGDNETMDIQEEGSAVVLSARKINFIGADITATSAGGGVANVTVSGGGGGGGGDYTLEAKSADFTAAVDNYYTIDSSGGPIAVTLPNAATVTSGKKMGFKARHGASNAVTLDRSAGGSIDGLAANLVMSSDMAAVELICDGADWWIKS